MPFVIDDENIKEEVLEDESFVGGREGEENEGEEEELEGNEDRLGDNDKEDSHGVNFKSRAEGKDPFICDDKEMAKKEHDIPMFHARRPPHCPSNLIKVGNDKAAITRSKGKKYLKPITAMQRATPPPALPLRSKSEQPRDSRRGGTPVASRNVERETLTKPLPQGQKGTARINDKGSGTLPFPVVKKLRQPGTLSQGDKPGKSEQSGTNTHNREQFEPLTCPICSREMQMTNTQLNEHIDYCLSRGTILEARGAAL